MRMLIAVLGMALVSGAAHAQTGAPILAGDRSLPTTPDFSGFYSSHETPSLRRQKVERALSLRDETQVLLAQDSGTLSDKNQRYVRRKARAILAND